MSRHLRKKVYDCKIPTPWTRRDRRVSYYFFEGREVKNVIHITIIEVDVKNVLLQVLGAMGE